MEVCDRSASCADGYDTMGQDIHINSLQEDIKENRQKKEFLANAICFSEPVSDGSIVKNCTGGFVVQMWNDSENVRSS